MIKTSKPSSSSSENATSSNTSADVSGRGMRRKRRPFFQKDNRRNSENKTSMDDQSIELGEILSKRYGGVSVYVALLLLLTIGILWTAVLSAEQVQQYHEDYITLQKMKKEHRQLQIENQRLVIEQQTFSATPQIASRAITELGMYSPTTKDKLILQPTAHTVAQAIPETSLTVKPLGQE